MIPPDVFCMGCKAVFDGFEAYHEHLEPVEEPIEEDE